ncbi:MAG: lysophospholipid acyltransferase family protein [Geminicoccaceae bacterium]
MTPEQESVLELEPKSKDFEHQRGRRPAFLTYLYELVFYYGALLAFAVITGVWSLAGSILYAILPLKVSQAIGPRMVMGASKCFMAVLCMGGKVKVDLAELDRLYRDGGIIIAPNHPTMLDAVMIISRLPRIVCISKAELWDNPLLGGGMRMAGFIRNDTPIKLTKLAIDKLQEGQQLLLFPEGTRTTAWPVNPFRGGFALMAKMAGVPVQTVFIETNSPFLNKGWPLLKKPDMPLEYRVRLGQRFEVDGDVKQFVGKLEGYFRDELNASRRGRPTFH